MNELLHPVASDEACRSKSRKRLLVELPLPFGAFRRIVCVANASKQDCRLIRVREVVIRQTTGFYSSYAVTVSARSASSRASP
jgi:hypothetical protein